MTKWKYTGRSKARFYKLFGNPGDESSAFVRPFDGWETCFESDSGRKLSFYIDTMTYSFTCPNTGLIAYSTGFQHSISKAVEVLMMTSLLDKYCEAVDKGYWSKQIELFERLKKNACCRHCGSELPISVAPSSIDIKHCPSCGCEL